MRNYHAGKTSSSLRLLLFSLILATAGELSFGDSAPPPPRLRPGLALYVSPPGRDTNSGARRFPFATLERARDEIRARKRLGGLPKGGVEVIVRGGSYNVRQTFVLEAEDSGKELEPVVYRAAEGEHPVFTGGARLRGFVPVTDEAVISRLPTDARGKVVQLDLRSNGVTNILPLILGGFASGRGFRTHPIMELYFNGQPLPLAQSPSTRSVQVAELCQPNPDQASGLADSNVVRFSYSGDLPARWQDEADLWLYGYWFYDWADSYEKVHSLDPVKKQIVLAPPYPNYGFRKGQRFYAVNVLAELDSPGEWYLDRTRERIYLFPPSNPDRAVVELSVAGVPLVQLNGASRVRFEGLTWELGCADGMKITGGTNCVLAGCTLRRLAGNGVEISGGLGHGLLSCDLYTLGRGGVILAGGDRKTLTPARHFAENCHIYDLSRIDHTYTPAALVSGVGQHVEHNWFHDVPSSALRVGGNDHLVERNEINRAVLESDDQGAVDMWGDPTLLGNVYRGNYFHHIGRWRAAEAQPDCGQAAIRLDDAISGVRILGNIFYRCGAGRLGFGAVQIHGGKDNVLEENLFTDCRWAVSFSPWSADHWREFTKAPRNSTEIDPTLYSVRYPEMARLDQDLNANWLRRNLVLNCGAFLHRNGGGARSENNLERAKNSGFALPANGDFFAPKTARALRALGFNSLPASGIGLYRDTYRHELPTRLLEQLRAEQ